MRTVLIVLAVLAAVVAVVLGFGLFDTQDPHALGWLAVSVALFEASYLVADYWPRRAQPPR